MIESVELAAAKYQPPATQPLIPTTMARSHYSPVNVTQSLNKQWQSRLRR